MDTQGHLESELIYAPHADRGVGMTALCWAYTERLIDPQLAEP